MGFWYTFAYSSGYVKDGPNLFWTSSPKTISIKKVLISPTHNLANDLFLSIHRVISTSNWSVINAGSDFWIPMKAWDLIKAPYMTTIFPLFSSSMVNTPTFGSVQINYCAGLVVRQGLLLVWFYLWFLLLLFFGETRVSFYVRWD